MFGAAFGGLDEMAPTSTDQTTEQEDSSVEENTDSEHEENLEQNEEIQVAESADEVATESETKSPSGPGSSSFFFIELRNFV